MIRTQWIFILLIGLITKLYVCQSCTTKFNLDNILQDQIVINPAPSNTSIYQSQQYFYPRTFFTATPKILSSIQTYQVSNFSEINYFLTTKVSKSYVTFVFTAQNMKWTYLKVKFWLSARADLLIGTFTIQNIPAESSSSYDIAIPSTFSSFIDQKSIQLNYITGLKALTGGDLYEIDVANSGRSGDNTVFKVTVSTMGKTSITKIQVSYSIFNFQSSYFASGGGQINYTPITAHQYKKIHGSFAPIIYEIQGFDKIKLPIDVGFNLDFIVDLDLVLQTYAANKFNQLGVVYLSIGAQPKGVCSCDQYIMRDGCIGTCPAMTYPFINYAKGGKSCLTCSPKLNETINQFNTGCVCLEGLQRVDEYCIPKVAQIVQCTAKNTVLSNGACICIAGTQSISGNCESICKSNQNYNTVTSKCQCNFGYFNISGVCGVCSSDKVYNGNVSACVCPDLQYIGSANVCICAPTYYNFSGTCVKTCPSGYKKSVSNCVPDGNCSTNQVFDNGNCVCSNTTYLVNGSCTTCPTQTYYNSTSQTCIHCLTNCDVCFNYSSCGQCKKDYYYNQTSNLCVFNRTCTDNQQLVNGICQCVNGLVQVNGVCTTCLAGTFYNSVNKICQNCVISCLNCINSTSCNTCLPNYNFNAALGYCAPNCGANQTLINGSCQCIGNTYRINGLCTKCLSTQYYESSSKTCQPCMSNCISCTSALICDKCILTHYFNPASKACQISNCPVNQTIINGKCDCVDGTYRIIGTCSTCKPDQFYIDSTKACQQCTQNCNKCSNQLQCAACQPYFTLINGECKFNLYDLKKGYPQFNQKIIVTDFVSSEPNKARKLTSDQLNKIVQLNFNPQQDAPGDIIIQQNPNNMSQIRVLFAYCDYIPFDKFNTTYTFNDPAISIKEDIQVVNYNVLQSGLTHYLVS